VRLGLLRRPRRPQGGARDLPQHRGCRRPAQPRRRRGQLRRHQLPALPRIGGVRRADRQGVLLSRSFYPEGVEGLFEIYYAPADTFETVNTLGLPLYARAIPDRERDEWVRLEIESNPLPICTRPQVLRSARRT
jgi:hypothetical protein